MLMLLSPAKNLDFETAPTTKKYTQPDLLLHAEELIEPLRKLAPHDVSELMKISDKLGQLNYDRFQAWQPPFDESNAKQAALAFNGDVYAGLDAPSFSAKDFTFAQKHLRILSGLYGLLRPLDLIQPYRLEMGTKFANPRGKDLYAFWGEVITEQLNQQLKALKSDKLVNLASNEYFKAVKPKSLNADIITPAFKDWKNGQYKIISFYAKKARGLMSAYAIKEQITQAEDLKGFNVEGYGYNDELSTTQQWVFTRRE